MQLVGSAAYRRVVLEGHNVLHILEDVLGHDVGAAPAIQEVGVEPGVRLFQLEDNLVIAGLVDFIHYGGEGWMRAQPRFGHNGFDGEDNVIGRKGHAVIPVDTFP